MKNKIAIIGGGLAGLSLSIDLKLRGFNVVLMEKGIYPRHKVCGEYISMESRKYLERICPDLSNLILPQINHFQLSTVGAGTYRTQLDLGGFGISRYLLELLLYNRAIELGVEVLLNCKATDVQYDVIQDKYTISSNQGQVHAALICNASGRKSNFETRSKVIPENGTNYVGVKYHVKIKRDPSLIEIHNFQGGYCGISAVENGVSCLCYIANSKMLKNAGSVRQLENKILFQNTRLRKIFTESEFVTPEPFTVSGINFLIKRPASHDVIYLGDSAGSIAPITGNGMSIALRSSSVLAQFINYYFSQGLPVQQLMSGYTKFWNQEFSSRIKYSRYFQKLSEFPVLTRFTIRLLNAFPPLAQNLISKTHGQPFSFAIPTIATTGLP